MNAPLINARSELSWQRRLFSDATTAILWVGWLWMCRPAVKFLTIGATMSVEGTALTLACTSGLQLWDRLSGQPALRAQPALLPDYTSHFGLDTQSIIAGRNSSICVVHHDEQGRIVAIEPRQPAAGAAAIVVTTVAATDFRHAA